MAHAEVIEVLVALLLALLRFRGVVLLHVLFPRAVLRPDSICVNQVHKIA